MKLTHDTTVLVTGATGMLGSSLAPALARVVRVMPTSRRGNEGTAALDIRDGARTEDFIVHHHPDVVVHLAAVTDPEYCDQHPDEAVAVNVGGTRTIADVCRNLNVPLVYMSSSGIFDGTQDSYCEHDVPRPITVYGETKHAAERIVQSLPSWQIIRSGWLVGGGPAKDYQYVGMIMRQIVSGCAVLHAVTDKFGTITYIPDLIASVLSIIATQPSGVYHSALSGICTRYDIARAIVSALGAPIPVEPVDSTYFRQPYFVVRPRSEALHSVTLPPQRAWQDAIREYCTAWA